MVNAVYFLDSGLMGICQKPDRKSMHEKCWAPTRLSSNSWICGTGYESFQVQSFRCRKSMQKQSPPSFLWTSTTVLLHGLSLGAMAPTSCITLRCSHTSSSMCRAIRLKHSFMGVSSSTTILCSAVVVQPSSFELRAKVP